MLDLLPQFLTTEMFPTPPVHTLRQIYSDDKSFNIAHTRCKICWSVWMRRIMLYLQLPRHSTNKTSELTTVSLSSSLKLVKRHELAAKHIGHIQRIDSRRQVRIFPEEKLLLPTILLQRHNTSLQMKRRRGATPGSRHYLRRRERTSTQTPISTTTRIRIRTRNRMGTAKSARPSMRLQSSAWASQTAPRQLAILENVKRSRVKGRVVGLSWNGQRAPS